VNGWAANRQKEKKRVQTGRKRRRGVGFESCSMICSQNILAEMEEAPDADAKALVPATHPRMQELMARYGNVL
jgi:hypothetical protein